MSKGQSTNHYHMWMWWGGIRIKIIKLNKDLKLNRIEITGLPCHVWGKKSLKNGYVCWNFFAQQFSAKRSMLGPLCPFDVLKSCDAFSISAFLNMWVCVSGVQGSAMDPQGTVHPPNMPCVSRGVPVTTLPGNLKLCTRFWQWQHFFFLLSKQQNALFL